MNQVVFDSFLSSYGDLREYANTAEFKTESNDIEGVEYPCICKDIPQNVRSEIATKLSKMCRKMVTFSAMFMRLSPKDVHVPHIAHTDNSMGNYSLMIYMNDRDDAGTSFLRHVGTGISYAPVLQEFVDIVSKDQNKPDAWVSTSMVPMKQNRACIFDAGQFHCAQPIGGFGKGQKDARLVLTAFFS